jgi:nucleoside-specific outer membrane channel protein Tsx
MKNLKKIGLTALLICTSSAYSFSETNIQYMRGSNFKVPSTFLNGGTLQADDKYDDVVAIATQTASRSVTTFEHVSGWSYGDNYLFFDVTNIDKDGTEVYGEWHPRLSASKISGNDMSYGPIRDVLLALQVNMNGGAMPARSVLYGVGLDWNISGFNFVSTNLYIRKDAGKEGTGLQLTAAWAYPIEMMNTKWKFEGFFDWNMKDYDYDSTLTPPADKNVSNFLIEPQFLYDLGYSAGLGENRFYVGVEYTYWKNKFGIQSSSGFVTDEKNLKYMVKFYL